MDTSVRSFVCLFVLTAVLFIAVSSTAAAAEAIPLFSLKTIHLARDLHANVARMLRRSATFRSQCQRLQEAPSLVVNVEVDPTLLGGPFRARSTIRRYDSGLMLATVLVGPGDEQVEWLAHEFEHIVEQLDGWDLRQMATQRGSEVWYSGRDSMETTRAMLAGRAVRDEVHARQRPSDKVVE